MDNLNRQFGLIIAYLLPGLIALAGFAPFSPLVASWLRSNQTSGLGAPLYVLLAATAAGMVVSCFRWLLVDPLLAFSGVERRPFNAEALEKQPDAYALLVEAHYRHFQFFAHALLATIWTYGIYRSRGSSSLLGVPSDFAVIILCIALFAGSRDALAKYRDRVAQLARPNSLNRKDIPMTNGIDHNQGGGKKTEKPAPTPNSEIKPVPASEPHPREPHQGQRAKD